MHRVLTPADYRRVPWKNGAGVTTEIIVYPPRATLDDFTWRVSIADVARAGPFSAFPGVERTLVLIRGMGMRLTGAGEPLDIRAKYEAVTFEGDLPFECAPYSDDVRDFNLMVRRDAATGVLVVVRDQAAPIAAARFHICHAVEQACECLLAAHVPLTLNAGDTLIVDTESEASLPLHVNPLSSDAVALVASVDLVGSVS